MPAVLSAYRFHMFELAKQLEILGTLEALYTAMPKRLIDEIPSTYVRSHSQRALLRNGLERIVGPRSQLNWMVVNEFDKWCARKLGPHKITIHASSFTTNAMRLSKDRGAITICDRGAQHILAQRRLLSDERESLGLLPPNFDERLIDRELEEYDMATAIVVPSRSAYQSYVDNGVPPKKVRQISYGVDTTRFNPAPLGSRDLRKVLCVGALDPQKGQHYLVEAFARIQDPDLRLELLGAGHDKRFLEKLEGVDNRIIFSDTVPRSAMPALMAGAGVFALMSVQDGFGMVVAQAMACGLPVIVSDAVGASDLVVDGETGFVVPSGDVNRLTEVMSTLVADPELIVEMGKHARRSVMSLGDWNGYGKEYDLLCRQLVDTL